MNFSVAKIVVGLPVEGPFDYLIPDGLRNRIGIGDRVAVNFANAKRLGFVVGLEHKSSFEKLKTIDAILDEKPLLSEYFLRFASEFSRQYGCSLGESIETMLPVSIRKPRKVACRPASDNSNIRALKAEGCLVHSHSVTAHWVLVAERIGKKLKEGRGVIVLVPDSAQIAFVIHQLKNVLPSEIILHDSKRTDKEELEHWITLKEGKARVVIGIRSAVFAPMPALGLIVIYDEDSSSYREEQTPFYQARDVAFLRSSIEGCDLLFVSTAPSIEMLFIAKKNGFAIGLIPLENAIHKQLIDMTNFASKGPMMIAFPLRNSLEKVLADGGQSLIFINRRGFNTFTRCLFCGHVLRCERCESNLSYSSSRKLFECRRCNVSHQPPRVCPKCHKNYLRSQGMGVERIVQELRRIFPMARVEGYDGQTEIFPKKFDVLVATQAIFRKLGEQSFDCVGVLDIDAEFNRADYRSSHRAYSLLAHLSLLSKKRLEIQTFHVDNEVLRDFVGGRDKEFYARELKLRGDLRLPPYCHMVAVMLRGVDQMIVSNQAELLYNSMANAKTDGIELLSMQPDVIAKLRDKYRYTIVLRAEDAKSVLAFVKESLAKIKKKSGVVVTVQVDP